jgi:hypothetical protein
MKSSSPSKVKIRLLKKLHNCLVKRECLELESFEKVNKIGKPSQS